MQFDPEYDFNEERDEMVELLVSYGIRSERVLAAMRTVRRHMFIPPDFRWTCDPYGDHPCSIGLGQTISQPYIVAYMTELLDVSPGELILEVGTGSGYQAAVLAEMGAKVVSTEIRQELAESAVSVLRAEGYSDVVVIQQDGESGGSEYAPFDAVIGTCAAGQLPAVLCDRLREGGRFVFPVGSASQKLVCGIREKGRLNLRDDLSVVFVPMVKAH